MLDDYVSAGPKDARVAIKVVVDMHLLVAFLLTVVTKARDPGIALPSEHDVLCMAGDDANKTDGKDDEDKEGDPTTRKTSIEALSLSRSPCGAS